MEKINVFIKSLLLCAAIGMVSCTNYQYIDTGLANGKHDYSVWEYLHTQPDDWDSTILLIENAGMKAYFDGSMKDEQITFLGVTNLSILRLMLQHNEEVANNEYGEEWNRVADIPEEICQYILKRLIVPRRLTVNDIPKGDYNEKTGSETDGKVYPTLEGELFIYTFREDYNDIPEKGEFGLYVYLHDSQNYYKNRIVSTDIQMTNGVVHALSYNFDLTALSYDIY